MNAPSANFYNTLRDARRALALTQGRLAAEVGCKQSAISMLESGKADAVNRATLEKIAARLGITLPEPEQTPPPPPLLHPSIRRYCPSALCPSNAPFAVGDRLLFFPRTTSTGAYCPDCGELLENSCPGCGSPINPGACCTHCGTPYVTDTVEPASPEEWAQARRHALAQLRTL